MIHALCIICSLELFNNIFLQCRCLSERLQSGCHCTSCLNIHGLCRMLTRQGYIRFSELSWVPKISLLHQRESWPVVKITVSFMYSLVLYRVVWFMWPWKTILQWRSRSDAMTKILLALLQPSVLFLVSPLCKLVEFKMSNPFF